jgi:hypothetical protein
MSSEEHEKQGFTVRDRRRFSESGEVRPEYREGPAAETAAADPGGATAPNKSAQTAPQSTAAMEIDFSTFVFSLSTQALAHLGDIPHPVDKQTAVDLPGAKQLIDILGMLKEKTKGNLDTPETELLDRLLYDLRIRYVERARGRSEGA